MKNFFRAVKLGMRYRFTLLGAIVCSLMVALFWGANIGTVYPVVEVVFQGKAMPDWIDGEIARLEEEIQQRQAWLNQHQRTMEAPAATSQEVALSKPQTNSGRCARETLRIPGFARQSHRS